jgi:1-acyl-sn-glycerol-3-phosphate acyltransferase
VALLLMAGAAGEEWLDVAHRFGGSGGAFWGWLAGAAGMALLASIGLFRPAFALACEPLLWLMYAVRWRGGEEGQVPAHGPCLVIANHACWGDPLFLEKVLPRPTTPMMTSRFYDLPVLRFWMRHFGVIRVPEQPLKKETPEVQEAIAALKRGECLVIFPEGYLRRREEQPLRRFGRGIWLILRACPQVPIFACWIEGNWGSYTSYWNGPPTKNKRPDFRRPIRIAITGSLADSLLPDGPRGRRPSAARLAPAGSVCKRPACCPSPRPRPRTGRRGGGTRQRTPQCG